MHSRWNYGKRKEMSDKESASRNMSVSHTLDERLGAITLCLENQKAVDPLLLKLPPDNSVADAVVIASATSRKHAQGIARGLLDAMAPVGQEFSHMEGFDAGQWILLDCNDVMIHIFQPDTRNQYQLDELFRQACATAVEGSK